MKESTVVGSPARTVLVADETAFVRERFHAALSRAGHRAVVAGTRAELLARAGDESRQPDLVILDVRMAGSNVTRLVHQLRAVLPAQASIVVLSGTIGDTHTVRTLAELGVTAFVNEYTAETNIARALEPYLHENPLNRRTSPRVTLGISVSVRHDHTISTAVTLNLSRGGLAVRSVTPLPPGTAVRLKFRLPGVAGDLDCGACVVWAAPGQGMGLRFTDLSPTQQHSLDEFVLAHFFTAR